MPRGERTTDDVVDSTIQSIATSPKYRDLAPATIERVVRRRGRSTVTGLAKRARRELHHVLAGYHFDGLGGTAVDVVAAVEAGEPDPEIRARCADVLARHATSRERFPLLDDGYYREMFSVTGRPQSILDLASALHPFELRWMDLPSRVSYVAFDNNRRLAEVADRYLRAEGAGRAVHGDILTEPLDGPLGRPADLAFLLMTYHCLEAQHAGTGWEAIRAIPARWIAASVPVAGFGSRSKPKFAAIAQGLETQLGEAGYHYRVQEWETERLYLIATS